MALPEHIHHLLKQIGPQMDLAAVTEFTEQGLWMIEVREGVLIEVTFDEVRQVLVFGGLIGLVPEENAAAIHRLLLNYNYVWEDTGGARMAVDASEGEAILLLDQPIAALDLPLMQNIVRNLADAVELWRACFTAEPSPEAPELSTEAALMMGNLRV